MPTRATTPDYTSPTVEPPTNDGDLWLLFMAGFAVVSGLLLFGRRMISRALGVNEIGRTAPPTTRQPHGARPTTHQYEESDE